MVRKLQLGVRISSLHRQWLDNLSVAWGLNEGELIQVLIDRAWREYAASQGISVFDQVDAEKETRPQQP